MRAYIIQILCIFFLALSCDCQRYYPTAPGYGTLFQQLDGGITPSDDNIQILIGGQIVLNGLQSIVDNIGHPGLLRASVADLMEQLRNNNLDPMNILKLGRMYFNLIEQKGYKIPPEDKKLLVSAFNLIGHIFATPRMNTGIWGRKSGKPIDINVIDGKADIQQIINAIKEGLAVGVKDANSKNINQNLNFNINVITLLGLGQELKKKKLI